jgi:hypothetical protein
MSPFYYIVEAKKPNFDGNPFPIIPKEIGTKFFDLIVCKLVNLKYKISDGEDSI